MRTVRTRYILSFLIFLYLLFVVAGTKAADTPPQEGKVIKLADVLAHMLGLRQELALITVTMEVTPDDRPEPKVHNVQLREVLFQALLLLQQSNRLCYEFTRESFPIPHPPQHDIRPRHVFAVVTAAAERLACVREALQISAYASVPLADETKTLTDVFTAIVQAKRQLYVLHERKLSSTDVLAQVQLANGYTADIIKVLERFGEEVREPPMPPYQPGKRLVDAYKRLLACYELIRQIAQSSGLQVLALEPQTDLDIRPSDMYDIATLIVSQVRYFATLIGLKLPHTPPRLTRKLPAHVYRNAQWLEAQLHELQRLARLYPNWHAITP